MHAKRQQLLPFNHLVRFKGFILGDKFVLPPPPLI